MNSFKRFSILTLSMLTALTASVCLFPRASAETICSAASPAAPAAPELHTDNTEYNMLVRYDWTVGAGGDTLVLYTNPYDPTVLDTTTYTEYAFPYNLDDTLCTPYYLSAKSYNSTTNLYSEEESVEVCYIENNIPTLRNGSKCRYVPVGRFAHWMVGGYVPTSFDETFYIWSHEATWRDEIKGTLQYKDSYSDIEVEIPLFGTDTSTVTIEGVKFKLRTGPNKCSICVDQSGVQPYDVRFYFGIEPH